MGFFMFGWGEDSGEYTPSACHGGNIVGNILSSACHSSLLQKTLLEVPRQLFMYELPMECKRKRYKWLQIRYKRK